MSKRVVVVIGVRIEEYPEVTAFAAKEVRDHGGGAIVVDLSSERSEVDLEDARLLINNAVDRAKRIFDADR